MIKSNVRKRKDILPSPTAQFKFSSADIDKKNSAISVLDNKLLVILECLIILILTFLIFHYRSTATQSTEQLQLLSNQYTDAQNKWDDASGKLQDQIARLKIISNSDHIKPADSEPQSANSASSVSHNKDKDEWDSNDLSWIRDIQSNDKRSLQLQYGESPIRVLIETNLGRITLEMAPIRSMPHTVRYFVTLIQTGFWNGCHFFRNANHVIQANCHRRNKQNVHALRDGDDGKLKETPSIAFQEYDESLPYLHQKYSIGLAGRPGGPDFYINLVDNKRNHGPGGQGPKPDPCFANIVEGRDVVDKIHAMEHDGSAMMILKDWVEFVTVSVLNDDDE
eukprot:CAMPEP_0197077550 /NCGR_PEP_ID=MMETSP1384-20130603/212676_1 /TAXON_ID=29189 /ORGANISM="Ammonia sp." /LENGTH=336 /DNA_ID=CAMNT_0042516415 /DNA_START=46 /DNA_END=1056 /DNA_ORIENTATION=+